MANTYQTTHYYIVEAATEREFTNTMVDSSTASSSYEFTRFPTEVVLHNGESLFIGESHFIGDFNFDMKLPVKVKYTAASGGHVQSIAVEKE